MSPLKTALLLLTLVFCFPSHIYAQEDQWVINNFDSKIDIEETGSVFVEETITVDFKELEKHGIFRVLPYLYTSTTSEIYTKVDILSVIQDGVQVEYELSKDNNNISIKIGSPSKTISGRHSYTIKYKVLGVLSSYHDFDELYWNVTGNQWEVPIISSSATIDLRATKIGQTACYQGYSQKTDFCQSQTLSDSKVYFKANGRLEPYEGLTVAVNWEKDRMPIVKVEKPLTVSALFFQRRSMALTGIGILAGILYLIIHWQMYGRDYWFGQKVLSDKNIKGAKKPIGGHETIVVEYTPPDKLTPAELGVTIDETADSNDIVSIIIDLASREYIKITEIDKKLMKDDFELEKLDNDETKLQSFEKVLLKGIFSDGDKVRVSNLKRNLYRHLDSVKFYLYRELTDKRIFFSNPDTVRTKYFGIGFIIGVAGIILIFSLKNTPYIFIFDLAVVITIFGILTILISKFMPKKTAYGRDLYRRAKGYELFLKTAEKHKQQFLEDKNLINEVLPYVVMFGLTKRFAKAMKETGIKPNTPNWYISNKAFSADAFADNMSSLSSNLSRATAPKSSGSGGGGFSGGGFGGGGGGSW